MKDKTCNHNELENKVAILVHKKNCFIDNNGINIKKGYSIEKSIIKIKGFVIPEGINAELYNAMFINENAVKHIPFYETNK